MSRLPHAADYAHCEDLLRRDDRDRWLASLFVPRAVRPHIHALYAFSLEAARVREVVSEPLLGEVRFQWWRDALDGNTGSGAAANPVAAALLDTIARFDLPKAPLLGLIDARLADLYADPLESAAALESYTEATCANLYRLATLILDGEEAVAGLGVAGPAGIAYGITGLLRALPWHSARGQVFVPAEMLRAHGAEPGELADGRVSPGVLAALADLRASGPRASRYFRRAAAQPAGQKPSGFLVRLSMRALFAADGKARLRSFQDRHRAAAVAAAMDLMESRKPVGVVDQI